MHRITNRNESGRFIGIYSTLDFMLESQVHPFLFGYGTKCFSLLNGVIPINVTTSNNFFIDLFVESGVLGLFLLLLFVCYFLIIVWRIQNQLLFIVASLLTFDFVISAMFKADFAILRTFVLICFIFILSKREECFKGNV